MTLGELITALKKEDSNKIVPLGFGNPHSYRGYYEDLSFEPIKNITVGRMLSEAESALGKTFQGYKGGDYTMSEYTSIWLAEWGDCGEGIGPILLSYMFGSADLAL